MCRIGSYKPAVVGQIAGELKTLALTRISDAVRGLLLTQILLTDVIFQKINGDGENIVKFTSRTRLDGIFVPEAVRFLVRVVETAFKEDGILFVSDDASSLDE